jgi:hypothetical protein
MLVDRFADSAILRIREVLVVPRASTQVSEVMTDAIILAAQMRCDVRFVFNEKPHKVSYDELMYSVKAEEE